MALFDTPDGVKEVSESISEALKQRILSPILFAILVSWIGVNYKFLVVLFSENPFSEKFEYISNNIEISFWCPIFWGTMISLLLSSLDIFYRVVRDACTYAQQRLSLFISHRYPMDRKAQVEIFLAKDEALAALQKRVDENYRSQQAKEQELAGQLHKKTARLHYAILIGMGYNPHSSGDLVRQLLHDENERPEFAVQRDLFRAEFSKSRLLKQLILVIEYFEARGDGRKYVVSNRHEVADIAGVGGEEEKDYFVEVLKTLGLACDEEFNRDTGTYRMILPDAQIVIRELRKCWELAPRRPEG